MTETLPYNDYGSWMRRRFPFRVQKISIDAGFTCPNRDGSIGFGGCTYCNNQTFSPAYCGRKKTIAQQLSEGKEFFSRKYPSMKYMAYFQSFTNTYASLSHLRTVYEEALAQEDVIGLVIGTRPDCVSDELLDYLAELNRQTTVIVEYGIESTNEATLRRINRGHSFECSREAIVRTHQRGLLTGGHIILGLPGENEAEILQQAATLSALPLDILKMHQLQVIRGTRMAQEFEEHPFRLFTPQEYIRLIAEYLRRLRTSLVVERFVSQSPANLLIAPHWGLKNHEFTNLLVNYMKANGLRQGQLASNDSKDS